MGFLSAFGKVIIGLSVVGFLIGAYYAVTSQNLLFGVVATFGLVYGIYIGYLGIEVEGNESGGLGKVFTPDTSELWKRVALIESVLEPQLKEAKDKEKQTPSNERGQSFLSPDNCPHCGTHLTYMDKENNVCGSCKQSLT